MTRAAALLLAGALLAPAARAASAREGGDAPSCASRPDDCPCGPEDAVRQWWQDRLESIETEEWSPVWIRSAGGYDTALAPRAGTLTILPPERTRLNPNHIKALLLVRDAYVVRLRALSETFARIRDGDLGDRRRRQREADRAAKEIAEAEERVERAEATLANARSHDIQSGLPSSPMTETAEKGVERARAAFDATLQEASLRFPELLVHVDDVPLWRALTEADDEVEKFEVYEEYLDAGADQLSDLAGEVERYDTLEELWPLAGLESVRNEIVMQSELFGIPLLAGYMHALEGVWDQQQAIEGYEKQVFSGVMLGISVIAIPLGPLVCAGVTAIDVVMAGDELQIRLLDAEQARSSAPVTGARHLARIETSLDQAQVDAGFALVGVILDAPDVVRAIKGVKVIHTRPRPCPERPRTGGDPPPLTRTDPALEEPPARIVEEGQPERPVTDPDDEPIVILDDGEDLAPELTREIVDENLFAHLSEEEASRLGELVAKGQREGLDPAELEEVERLMEEARRSRTGGGRVDLPPDLPARIVDENLFAHLSEEEASRLGELVAKGQREGLDPAELEEIERLTEKARRSSAGAPARPRTGGERADLPRNLAGEIVDENLFAHLSEGDVDRLGELLARGQRTGLTPEELAEVEDLVAKARRAKTGEEARLRPRTGDPEGPLEEPEVDPDDEPIVILDDDAHDRVVEAGDEGAGRPRTGEDDEPIVGGPDVDPEDEPIVIVGEDAHRRITGEPAPRRRARTGEEGDPADVGESGGGRAAREVARKGAEETGRRAAREDRNEEETVDTAGGPDDGAEPTGERTSVDRADEPDEVSARPRTGGEGDGTAVAMASVPGSVVDAVDPIDFEIRPRLPDGDRPATTDAFALASRFTPVPVREASRDPTVQVVVLEGRAFTIPAAGGGDPAREVPGGGVSPDPDLLLHVVSEGGLGAGAMRIVGFNGTGSPVTVDGTTLIVEPVDLGVALGDRVRSEITDLARGNPWTASLDAYCAQIGLRAPDPGTVFRIASRELQERYAPLRSVMEASRRLREAGLLHPDSDPDDYFRSIRQWAIWTLEERLDPDGFAETFVEQARKNLEGNGGEWSEEVEEAVRGLVPGRWSDVQRILERVRRDG